LQETLCDDLLDEIMRHPAVRAAQVATRKPDVYPDCEAVGVQAFRQKD
jgi:dihydroneopterin aldolase